MSLADDYEGSFSNLTNRSEYQRQSWRDSYNGGRAAGDLTGAVNARLDAERAAFQGATWGGSSTQPSALQLARAIGAGRVMYVGGGGGHAGSGPGVGSVISAPTFASDGTVLLPAGPGASGARAGSKRSKPRGPGALGELPETTPIFIGGREVARDLGWSDAGDAEQRWGEGEFLSPTWFYQWGVVTADYLQGQKESAQEYRKKHGVPEDIRDMGPGALANIVGAFGDAVNSLGGYYAQMASARLNKEGVVIKTGGGF